MSATVIPNLMPSRRTSWRDSPAASRSFSLCQIGLTISATGRSGFGNATAGAPASAMNSCAEPDTASKAAKTAAIVIRITSLASNLRYTRYLSISDMILQRRDRSDLPMHQKRLFYDHDLWSLPTLRAHVFQFLYGLSTRLELK